MWNCDKGLGFRVKQPIKWLILSRLSALNINERYKQMKNPFNSPFNEFFLIELLQLIP